MAMIGFSTGAIAKGDFHQALEKIRLLGLRAVELSALREHELDPLIASLDQLNLDQYDYVSFHAPSKFEASAEDFIIDRLTVIASRGWHIIVHPDSLINPRKWLPLSESLCFENMDKRKPVGRTAKELSLFLDRFEGSTFCFDVGHAHQIDKTMTEARLLVQKFYHRLVQVHMSEVNTRSEHVALSSAAAMAFSRVMDLLPDEVPLILESVLSNFVDLQAEVRMADKIFSSSRYVSIAD